MWWFLIPTSVAKSLIPWSKIWYYLRLAWPKNTYAVYWYCVLILCTDTVYWYCVLVLCTDTVYWYCVLILCIDNVYWYCVLTLCTGTVYWYCVLILCTDTVYWYCALILCIGTVYWYCALILCTDTVYWYCVLILYTVNDVQKALETIGFDVFVSIPNTKNEYSIGNMNVLKTTKSNHVLHNNENINETCVILTCWCKTLIIHYKNLCFW